MDKAIKNYAELKEFFHAVHRPGANPITRSVLVDSAVRKECMTSTDQSKMIVNGAVKKIVFRNLKGGVYKALLQS